MPFAVRSAVVNVAIDKQRVVVWCGNLRLLDVFYLGFCSCNIVGIVNVVGYM